MSIPPPINPYASPAIADPQQAAGPALPALPLYSPTAVSIATFFGSLTAGAVIMAMNYYRCERRAACWWILGLGFGATCLIVVVAMFLPDEFPAIIIAGAQTVLAHVLATRLQQPLIRDHLGRGGELASGWWAFGISLAVAAVLAAVFVAVLVGGALLLGEEF